MLWLSRRLLSLQRLMILAFMKLLSLLLVLNCCRRQCLYHNLHQQLPHLHMQWVDAMQPVAFSTFTRWTLY